MNNLCILIENLAEITQPQDKRELNRTIDFMVELWAEDSYLSYTRYGKKIYIKHDKSIYYTKN